MDDSFLYQTYFNFAFNRTNSELERNGAGYKFRALFRAVSEVTDVLSAGQIVS